ncbi:MAG: nickel-responsive transcriptional regulator NikR [Candidatus Omnitrophota bacterium]
MAKLARFGVSLDKSLLVSFDRLCRENKYVNRSEALRDLIRDRLVKEEWKNVSGEVTAVVTLVYDHEKRELVDKLINIQHDRRSAIIIASQHIHLNHDNCLEVIIAKGKAGDVKDLASRLRAAKGVKHGEFVMTTLGEDME